MSKILAIGGRLLGRGRHSAAPVHDGAAVDTALDAERTAAAFRSVYGMDPVGVWWAPYTAPLIGEHVGGGDARVLSTALPWGMSLAFTPASDGSVQIRSTQAPNRPLRFRVGQAARTSPTWAAPVASAVRESADAGARLLFAPGPLAATSETTAVCAALLAVSEAQLGADAAVDRSELARTARRALAPFHDSGAVAVDPAAVLGADQEQAFFLDPRGARGRLLPFPLREAGLRLLLIDAGTTLPDRLTSERRDECSRAAAALGVDALRDVPDLADALNTLKDPLLRRRVQHAVTEVHRVNALAGLLRAGSAAEAGPILNASHLSLRDAFATVCPRLDTAADTAVRNGARGARMTGSGRQAIALVPAERLERVCEGVRAAFDQRRWAPPEFGIATPSQGAHRVL